MKYGIKAYLLHDIGSRTNQEDAHYPPFIDAQHFDKVEREEAYYDGEAHTEDSLFILCDGMGGHSRGEVASNLVCEVMGNYLTDAEKEGKTFTNALVQDAVSKAFFALDANDDSAEERKMGTTMTLLKLHQKGALIAHIGDSRVYHIRPAYGRRQAQVLFRTEDHSLVNMLLRKGELTPHQAQHFPQKHVLVKAMSAGQKEHPAADVYETKDILPGDVFFMCSDGILEELYDEDLTAILTNPDYTDEERVQMLLSFCKDNKDNHTAWIVKVETVEGDDGMPISIMPDEEVEREGFIKRVMGLLKRI